MRGLQQLGAPSWLSGLKKNLFQKSENRGRVIARAIGVVRNERGLR